MALCIWLVAASPAGYAFQASGPITADAPSASDGALPDAPPPSEDVTLKGLPDPWRLYAVEPETADFAT